MDLRDYYDQHWTALPEGQVDYRRLEMIVARVEPGEHVLEAGCGPGFLAKLLKDKGANVIGTDVSRVGAERTARRGIETHHVDRAYVEPTVDSPWPPLAVRGHP